MGSIGRSEREEQAYQAQLRQSNSAEIIQFPNDEYDEEVANDQAIRQPRSGGWDFPGFRDSIDEVEKRLAGARSDNTLDRLARRLNELDKNITTSMNTAGEYDDTNMLLTYRRRVRGLLKQIKNRRQ